MTESTVTGGLLAWATVGFGEWMIAAPPALGCFGSGVVQISHEWSRGELRNVHVGQATCASSPSGAGEAEADDAEGWLGRPPAAESGRECGMLPGGVRMAIELARSDRSLEMPHIVQLTRRSAAPGGAAALA
jgi:hypothetical protein